MAFFRKRWLRRALVGVLVTLTLTVIGFSIDRYLTRRSGEKRHAAIVAHIEATDPRWRYDEIDADRGTLPDDQNSAMLVPKFVKALGQPRFDKDELLASGTLSSVPPNHVRDDDTYDSLNAAIGNNVDALDIALSFGRMPKGLRRYQLAPNYIDTLLPEAQDTRAICRLLDLASEYYGRNGRGGTALGYIEPMMNVSRSLDGEPFLISGLVRLACDTIIVHRVERTLGLCNPRTQLPAIQGLLSQEAESDLFWYALRGERACFNQLFTNFRTGKISVSDISKTGSSDGILTRLGTWHMSPHMADDHALMLEMVTELYEARQLPEHQQRAVFKRFEFTFRDKAPKAAGSLLTSLLTPAYGKIHDASLRAKAHLRCAVAGIAVERFRLQNNRWPANLEEIPKHLLQDIPLDPFDGKPLKYVVRIDGVTVYSIGLDEQDDDGKIKLGKSNNEPGQDVGFRLYNPDRRGLPALPRRYLPQAFEFGPNGELIPADDERTEQGPEPREVEP